MLHLFVIFLCSQLDIYAHPFAYISGKICSQIHYLKLKQNVIL